MTKEEFYDTAKCCCGFYSEPFSELQWCTHADNKNQLEGNCQPKDCPIKSSIKELNKARKLL